MPPPGWNYGWRRKTNIYNITQDNWGNPVYGTWLLDYFQDDIIKESLFIFSVAILVLWFYRRMFLLRSTK